MQLVDDIKVAPSILSADMLMLQAELDDIKTADFLHVDVMDGSFVPNLTFGPVMLEALRRGCDLPIEAHLMIRNADTVLDSYLKTGVDLITIHYEATIHAHRLISRIHDAGLQAGISINPATPVSVLEEIINDVDLVLLMSVNPGFGGQKFISSSIKKLKKLKALMRENKASAVIEVDGGVTKDNIASLAEAGCDMVVAGSSVYGKKNRAQAIAELKEAARAGRTMNA